MKLAAMQEKLVVGGQMLDQAAQVGERRADCTARSRRAACSLLRFALR
jgi:hypothetical protein